MHTPDWQASSVHGDPSSHAGLGPFAAGGCDTVPVVGLQVSVVHGFPSLIGVSVPVAGVQQCVDVL
jgi:hypothetical protein